MNAKRAMFNRQTSAFDAVANLITRKLNLKELPTSLSDQGVFRALPILSATVRKHFAYVSSDTPKACDTAHFTTVVTSVVNCRAPGADHPLGLVAMQSGDGYLVNTQAAG